MLLYETPDSIRACIVAARGKVSEAVVLKLLNIAYADRIDAAHRRTQLRMAWLRAIRDCAENGKVALVRGGCDCDGVQYGGDVSIVKATVAAVDARVEHDLHWADGPMYHTIMRPSEARRVQRTQRDLALEAFENGHSHYLTTADTY